MPTKEQKAEAVKEVIAQSCGTEHHWRHMFGLLYTDGVKGVAEAAGAYWLLDVVVSYQSDPKIRRMPFQVWKLVVNPDCSAVVTMREDSGKPIRVTQEIPCTDFPLPEIEMWLESGVLILPGEH